MAKISLLDKKNRRDESISATYYVPKVSKRAYEFHALINKADLEDPTLRLNIDVDISDDGVNWRYWGGVVYVGGVYDNPGIPGVGTLNVKDLMDKHIRIRVKPNKLISIGAEVEDKDGNINTVDR